PVARPRLAAGPCVQPRVKNAVVRNRNTSVFPDGEPVLASPAAPASLDALLAHLFASRFAHPFVYRLLRQRFPMTLPRGVNRSPADTRRGRFCLFRRCLRSVFPRDLANCHEFLSRWTPYLCPSGSSGGLSTFRPCHHHRPASALPSSLPESRRRALRW